MSNTTKPTIVLVHGAFADASSWNGVIELVQAKGHGVVAPANPLRGLTNDSSYIASVINQIDGPVLLVGHSYAGAILSNMSTAKNIVGLEYVAAFVLNEGQTLNDVGGQSKDSILGPNLFQTSYPKGESKETGTEFTIKIDKMREVFAADVPEQQAKLMAVTQRAIADLAFIDVCGPASWKNLPTWAIVSTKDVAAGTDAIRAAAQQGDIKITELDGSHAIMVSKPKEVAEVILKAVESF